jgi:hypothetical protein
MNPGKLIDTLCKGLSGESSDPGLSLSPKNENGKPPDVSIIASETGNNGLSSNVKTDASRCEHEVGPHEQRYHTIQGVVSKEKGSYIRGKKGLS